MIGAQSACSRFIVGETALYLAKSAFIDGMPTNGKGFSLEVSRHDSFYHAGEFKNKGRKRLGMLFYITYLIAIILCGEFPGFLLFGGFFAAQLRADLLG